MTSRRTRTAALVTLLLFLPEGTAAQSPTFTANPVMVKGAPDAPVTIVEFSDYQ